MSVVYEQPIIEPDRSGRRFVASYGRPPMQITLPLPEGSTIPGIGATYWINTAGGGGSFVVVDVLWGVDLWGAGTLTDYVVLERV